MLDRVDRILVAAEDAGPVAERWCALLDAVIDRQLEEPGLGSRKTVLRLGDAELEIHQPVADGPISDHLRTSGGPFAVGLATNDLPGLQAHLRSQNIDGIAVSEDRRYYEAASLGIPGLRVMLSETEDRTRIGLIDTRKSVV